MRDARSITVSPAQKPRGWESASGIVRKYHGECTVAALLAENGGDGEDIKSACLKAALAGFGGVPRDTKCPLEHIAEIVYEGDK